MTGKQMRFKIVQTEKCPHCGKDITIIRRNFVMDEDSLSQLSALVKAAMGVKD